MLTAAMLLEVLISTTIFDKLGSAWQHIRVRFECNGLNHVCGQQMHKGLNFVHLRQHVFGHGVLHREAFEKGVAREALDLVGIDHQRVFFIVNIEY